MDFSSFTVRSDPVGYPDLKVVDVPRVPPAIDIPGPLSHWKKAYDSVFSFIGDNIMAPTGIFDDVWHRPGPIWRGTWLWDNAFHSKVWSLCNVEFARYVLESHMKFQVHNPGDEYNHGRVPHSITSPGGVNGWTQPPLMAWAFWELYKKNGDVDMLSKYFGHLLNYHFWLNFNRDLNKDGLYSWMHGFESGLDNAPRYDEVSSMECDAPDFSACVSVQLRSLAYMATILGEDTTLESLEARKRELDDWINKDLWDPKRAFYFDRAFDGDRKGEFIGPKAISGWYPLFAGIVPKDRLPAYLDHLTNPGEFWTPMPVPSVAKDEPSFSKDMNMWRGPVWINTNYMIVKGLKGYGFRELPGELAYLTVSTVFDVFKDKEMFYEYYGCLDNNKDIESFARKGEHDGPRPYFLGWTGLVANLLLEDILGIEVQHDAILLVPSMPEKLIAAIGRSGTITGSIPGVPGWDQDRINFTILPGEGNVIEYRFNFSKPMDIHVLEYASREDIHAGAGVRLLHVELVNNKDIFCIASRPDGDAIREQYTPE